MSARKLSHILSVAVVAVVAASSVAQASSSQPHQQVFKADKSSPTIVISPAGSSHSQSWIREAFKPKN